MPNLEGPHGIWFPPELYIYVTTNLGALSLASTNKRGTRCVKCGQRVPAGRGVAWSFPFQGKGFLCYADSKAYIVEGAGPEGSGYRVDLLGNLAPVRPGHVIEYTPQQVAEALVRVEDGKPIKVE